MATDTKVTLRMPQEVRNRIAEMAGKEHRSMAGQIVAILERAVEEYFKERDERAMK